MDEYVTKEQVIDWYRPYGQTDEPIPFETLVSDLRDMKTADVSQVLHGQWGNYEPYSDGYRCSCCKLVHRTCTTYCPNCGCRMDLEG